MLLLQKIAEKLKIYKGVIYGLTGGEPTLHPEFRQIIEYADTFGISHSLFSSVRWENPDEVIRTYLKCKNFIGMLIGLHGSTEFAHNAFVRISHAFDETCKSVRRASEAGLEVFSNTVLTRHSCGQIEDIISLSQELGAGCAVFNRFLAGDHPLQPSEDQLREAVLLIEKLQHQGVSCHIGNCIPKCFVKNSSEGANAGIEHCAVSPEGLVRLDNLTGCVFGNIFEKSIEEIWA
jgi:MoaA/NifB/PqqE/SkfB family radical SAM enzyme